MKNPSKVKSESILPVFLALTLVFVFTSIYLAFFMWRLHSQVLILFDQNEYEDILFVYSHIHSNITEFIYINLCIPSRRSIPLKTIFARRYIFFVRAQKSKQLKSKCN